jgi:hypothetical protein
MNTNEIALKVAQELLTEGPSIEPTKIILRDDDVLLFDGNAVAPDDKVYEFSQKAGSCEVVELKPYSAEQWLDAQGFSSVRLITLLDLERRFSTSPDRPAMLGSVRAWVDGVLSDFVENQSPRYDWPQAPFSFEETTKEAFLAASNPDLVETEATDGR